MDTSYKGHDVVASLERACRRYGKPERICVDNGPEFISKDLDLWAYLHKVVLDYSRPGKPTDKAFIESFNGRFRDECLNQRWFLRLEDAQTKIEDWCDDYNTIRPHSSVVKLSPEQFLKKYREPLSPVAPADAYDEQDQAHSRRPQVLAAG